MADKTEMQLMDNGPILVRGDFKLTFADGREIPLEGDVIALCRCGASANKPFCDGSHKQVGFSSDVPGQVDTGLPGSE
jgi:CDGSH-type Zn-finger protein